MPRTRRAYQSDVNDPGCVKTLQARKCGEWNFSDHQNWKGTENSGDEISSLKDN